MNTEQRRQKLNEIAHKGVTIPPAVYLALDSDTAPVSLQGWLWHAFLWDRPHARTWMQAEWGLKHAQERWDESQKHVSAMRTLEEERHGREADAQRERDAEIARREAERLETLTARLRSGYLAVPGRTEADFQVALPELLDARARESALAGQRDIESPLSKHDILGR